MSEKQIYQGKEVTIMKKHSLFRILLSLLFICCLFSAAIAENSGPGVEQFFLTRSTDLPSVTFELLHIRDDWYFCQDAGIPRKVTPALIQELNRIVSQYDLISWNGFSENDPDVLDGEMFSLHMVMADGTNVSAAGCNVFPDHYFEFTGEIDRLLREIPVSPACVLPGEYRYEGEGFGGNFTLTVSEDKTFLFSEGYLSSYLGTGTWFLEGARLYLEERESPFYRFVFMPTADALFYLADESDPFPYVQVANHARFDKLSQENGAIVADLSFRSFSGGGPEYSVQIEDPEVLICTKSIEYESETSEIPGAPYTVTLTFTGLKAGESQVVILENSPLTGSHQFPFLALVDQWGNVSLTVQMGFGSSGDQPVLPDNP